MFTNNSENIYRTWNDKLFLNVCSHRTPKNTQFVVKQSNFCVCTLCIHIEHSHWCGLFQARNFLRIREDSQNIDPHEYWDGIIGFRFAIVFYSKFIIELKQVTPTYHQHLIYVYIPIYISITIAITNLKTALVIRLSIWLWAISTKIFILQLRK